MRDTLVGNLKAKVFTLKTDDGGDVTYRNFLLLYTQDATYTFEYVYPATRADFVKNEFKPFISSIRIAPQLQRNDQYLSNATGMSPTTKIEVYGGPGLVVILVIVFIVRRKNRVALS